MNLSYQAQLGRNLRATRLALGLTQDQVEALTEGAVRRGSLSHYENGRQPVTAETLAQLAAAYRVEPWALMPARWAP